MLAVIVLLIFDTLFLATDVQMTYGSIATTGLKQLILTVAFWYELAILFLSLLFFLWRPSAGIAALLVYAGSCSGAHA